MNKDKGFSLLELVIAVGVLMILTVIGLLTYRGITDSARQAAVNNAAETIYNRAMTYKTEGTTIQKAVEEWNKASGMTSDIAEGEESSTKDKITVVATELDNDSFEIRATYGGTNGSKKFEAVKKSPGLTTGTGNDNDGELPPIVEAPLTGTILHYVCDSDFTATLPSAANNAKLSSSTVLKLTGDDGTDLEITGAPITQTLKSGVEYKLLISGEFATLHGNDCLRTIDNIDKDSGITTITALGKNIVSVPKTIPSTVNNLSSVFQNSAVINDPNISEWDISGVTNLANAFRGAKSFNQSVNNWNTSSVNNMSYTFAGSGFNNGDSDNDHAGSAPLKWNVSNVMNMSGMFNGNYVFNQNLNSWDTGKVTNMSQMFSSQDGGVANYISGFNNGGFCRSGEGSLEWDTHSVSNFSGMFFLNMCFNQKINQWNTSSAKDMSSMFALNIGFDQPLNDWNVSNVTNMGGMFSNNGFLSGSGATPKNNRFNQPLDKWNTSNVTNMSGMFYNNGRGAWGIAMSHDLTMWNVSNVSNYSNFVEPEKAKYWTTIPQFN